MTTRSLSSPDPEACVLEVRVVPNGKVTRFEGVMDDGSSLRIRLAAPPVDGKANEELVCYLARALDLRRNAIAIVSGEKARMKRLRIEGVSADEAIARLRADAGSDRR